MEDIIKKCLPTYEIISKIGEGVNGAVYHVRDNLKERAVKVVPIMVERSFSRNTPGEMDSKISHDFHAVQSYYSKIKGEGVVEIYDFHLVDKQVSRQQARAYLILLMEYCPNNLLNRVLDNHPLPPKSCQRLAMELAVILKRLCHSDTGSFIVKDLKPSNLLLNPHGKLLIGDLGGLQRLSSATANTANAQFTPNWSAPEILLRNENAGIASLIFSYGFVCYFIWFGKLPYEHEDFDERFRRIKTEGLAFPRQDIPEIVRKLISQCLRFAPGERPPDFETIIERLNEQNLLTARQASAAETAPAPAAEKPGLRAEGSTGSQSKNKKSIRADIHNPGDIWMEPLTGMEFAWVPSGFYHMGCGSWDAEGNRNEFPVHKVLLDGFWIGRYPVTQQQWKKIMSPAFWKMMKTNNPAWFRLGDAHPVEQISWHDTHEFIQKLDSMNKGRYHFRLPTEAEWEYAARSCGRAEKYPGGGELEKLAWYYANSGMTTRPVGQKQANGLGLYDMSGNVYEWCLDVYLEDAYKKHREKNPLIKKNTGRRILRGGSWSNSPHELRCSYRANVYPDFKGNYIGFRVVMTPISRRIT
ncbi:MAG: SUMF1/EgtB/PvdO family nonheme iron enzyme [Desulfosalsimonadaceae bacterium]